MKEVMGKSATGCHWKSLRKRHLTRGIKDKQKVARWNGVGVTTQMKGTEHLKILKAKELWCILGTEKKTILPKCCQHEREWWANPNDIVSTASGQRGCSINGHGQKPLNNSWSRLNAAAKSSTFFFLVVLCSATSWKVVLHTQFIWIQHLSPQMASNKSSWQSATKGPGPVCIVPSDKFYLLE